VKHFHEQLQKRHHYKLGYTVTRLALQRAGLVRTALGASQEAVVGPLVGMMLHQDDSRFAWLPGDNRQYDLVVTSTTRPARLSRRARRARKRQQRRPTRARG
jgi:hypothetical protein